MSSLSNFNGYDLSIYTVDVLYAHLYSVIEASKYNRAYPYSRTNIVNELLRKGETQTSIDMYIRSLAS